MPREIRGRRHCGSSCETVGMKNRKCHLGKKVGCLGQTPVHPRFLRRCPRALVLGSVPPRGVSTWDRAIEQIKEGLFPAPRRSSMAPVQAAAIIRLRSGLVKELTVTPTPNNMDHAAFIVGLQSGDVARPCVHLRQGEAVPWLDYPAIQYPGHARSSPLHRAKINQTNEGTNLKKKKWTNR